eukprot:4836511-Amphidinium_carterae.1
MANTHVLAYGSFQGGQLWIKEDKGVLPPPVSICWSEEHAQLKGIKVNTKNTWVEINPQKWHGVYPAKWNRCSVALYTPAHFKRLSPELLKELTLHGFPWKEELIMCAGEAKSSGDPLPRDPGEPEMVELEMVEGSEKPSELEDMKDVDQEAIQHILELEEEPAIKEKPKTPHQARLVEEHQREGHYPKSKNCPACMTEDGARVVHRRNKDVSKYEGTLYIESAYINKNTHFIVMGLRVNGPVGMCLVPWYEPVDSLTSADVAEV